MMRDLFGHEMSCSVSVCVVGDEELAKKWIEGFLQSFSSADVELAL
jgi:hypothetical protein